MIKYYEVKNTKDIQAILEVEPEDHLGCERYNNQNKSILNSRNGYRSKRVKSDFGEVKIK